MEKQVQFIQIQTTPQQLIDATVNGIRIEIENLKKEFQPREPEELLTRNEVKDHFKVDLSTIWSWTKKGKLRAYGCGNRVYYKRSEIEQVLTPLN
jgi:hypothetical protein